MEEIIKEGSANFKKSTFDSKGGKLTLTNERLIFQAGGYNFGGKTKIDLNLNQLVRVESGRTYLISGDIEVFDRYNNQYTFLVYGRKAWAAAIEEAIIANRENDINADGGKYMVAAAKQSLGAESTPTKSTADILLELKSMKDAGLITEPEYEKKRQDILNRM